MQLYVVEIEVICAVFNEVTVIDVLVFVGAEVKVLFLFSVIVIVILVAVVAPFIYYL